VAPGRSEGRALVSRIGVLGGAFNPPHIGHLVLAHEAADQLDLEQVLLIPVGIAPHRQIDPEPGAEVRLEMVRAAADGDEVLSDSDFEVRSGEPSYTFRTLEVLHDERPGVEITLLMGADVASSLGSWRKPERVLELARVGVAGRPGTDFSEAEESLEKLGAHGRFEMIRMPGLGISSTRVRRRVAAGRSIRYLVPDKVRALISERSLYKDHHE
jgi:nicotinate-nucleotide adenylyltransferase